MTRMMVKHLAEDHQKRPARIAESLGVPLDRVLAILEPDNPEAHQPPTAPTTEELEVLRQARMEERADSVSDLFNQSVRRNRPTRDDLRRQRRAEQTEPPQETRREP